MGIWGDHQNTELKVNQECLRRECSTLLPSFSKLENLNCSRERKNGEAKREEEPAWWSWRCFFVIFLSVLRRRRWRKRALEEAQDVCLAILFSTAGFHFFLSFFSIELKVQVIHIFKRFQHMRRCQQMQQKRMKIDWNGLVEVCNGF